jgi:cardiolipin synthase
MRRGVRAPALRLALAALAAASCTGVTTPRLSSDLDVRQPSFLASVSAHADARFVSGNRVDVLLDGDGTFPRILEAIRGARRSITFAQYFYDEGPISDEIAAALADRCRDGVEVHVLIDAVGGGIPRRHVTALETAGCQFEWFRRIELRQFLKPWSLLAYNNRSHRRILVVDGKIGFTGGYGISEAWMGDGHHPGHWRDTNVEFEGPVVQQLQAAFVQNWWSTTGTVLVGDGYFPALHPVGDVTAQVVKSSPGAGASESYMMFLLAIAAARRSIHVTNPYFVVDEPMKQAFVEAAHRGVEVTIIVPGQLENELVRVDQNLVHYAGRGELGPLLEAGIRVFEYKAALLHAKTMVVDGLWATVGSTNLDRRSFELNDELNLTVRDARVAAVLEDVFARDLEHSAPLTYERWRSRGLRQRIFELFAVPAKSQL